MSEEIKSVRKAEIDALVNSLEFKYARVEGSTVTGCWAFLPNGFKVGYGESACIDSALYSFDIGCKYAKERCLANATDKLWELEGYLLKSQGTTSVIKIAKTAHEINAALCIAYGDTSQSSWDEAPEWQRESAVNGVMFHMANPDASPSASHDNWLEEKVLNGWRYGKTKDPDKKTHPCCVEYDKLPPEQKAKDYLFRQVVHSLALAG